MDIPGMKPVNFERYAALRLGAGAGAAAPERDAPR